MSQAAIHPVKQYFAQIWSATVTCVKGMAITWNHMFRKPVTIQYPEQASNFSPNFRGLHVYDIDNCDACYLCAKACPVECLTLETEGRGKKAVVKRYSIDYSKCLFCNLCCEPCPTYAIWMGTEWDLSSFSREGCVVNFNVEKSTADNKNDPEKLAREAYTKSTPLTKVQKFREGREAKVAAGDESMRKSHIYEELRRKAEEEKAAKRAARDAAKKAADEKTAAAKDKEKEKTEDK